MSDTFQYYYRDLLGEKAIAREEGDGSARLWVEKCPKRHPDYNHKGGLMLVDKNNTDIDGANYDLSPEDVIRLCPQPQYIYWSTVKERGWSDFMIEMYLGKPDKIVPNPHHRSRCSQLYALKRVIAAEQAPEFEEWRATSAARHARVLELAEKLNGVPHESA
jgi:hypothetical protein